MASSLPNHPDYPALPIQATDIAPDAGCSGCPFSQRDGHKTCSTFRMKNDPVVPAHSRLDLKQFRQWQYALHRRAFDVDGIIAGNNGAYFDYWYYYNAAKQINFAWFGRWKVISAQGNTLTIELPDINDPDADARKVLFAAWSERETVSPFGWPISGFAAYTSLQPLDMVEFQYPSVAANKLVAKIVRVISATRTRYILELDKAVDCCTSFVPVSDGQGGYEEDPDHATVKVYHYGREAEQWHYIQEPHYFLGRKVTREITTAEIPTDGILELEASTIAPPPGPDPLFPNFVMEGWSEGQWHHINDYNRLHIKPTQSTYSFKTTYPAGSVRTAPSTSLLGDYTKFRVTYYAPASADDPDCRIVGYDRCFHSRVDYSKSVGNYGSSKGVSIQEGKHLFCSKHVYEKYEYVDEYDRSSNPPVPGQDGIPDRVNTTVHHPSGLDDFPESGQCIQFGFCNHYVNSLDRMGDREAPFNVDHTMIFLRELWFATDKQVRQKHLLSFGPRGYITERIGNPSILYLNGFYGPLHTPHAYAPTSRFRGDGTWYAQKPVTVIDAETGSQTLQHIGGLERGLLWEYDADTDTWSVDHDRKGNIPAANPGNYITKRNPFVPNTTVNDDLLEYIGCQIERDTGQIVESRGLSNVSVALHPEDVIAPNFDLQSTTLQVSTRATYQKDAATGDGILKILPYRQETKGDASIGSRTIHSVTSLGNQRYRIEFENETKTFSRMSLGDLGTIGDSYNQIFSVSAGGGPCILPYEPQELSSYEGDKNTGSRAVGAQPLDCIEINGKRFVIQSVEPHGGSEAPTWGSRQLTNKGTIGGHFTVTVSNDDDGNPRLPIILDSIKRTSDNHFFAIVTEDEKPELQVNQAWFDGDVQIYFTHLNVNEWVEISYRDSANNSYVQGFWIQAYFTANTDTPYSEWTSASTKTVSIGGNTATFTVGGWADPAPGTCRINDNGGKIQLTFNISNGPADWRIHMTYNVDAAPPQDDWCVGGNFLSFAKKRDCIVVVDDGYGTDYFAENTVTGEQGTFYKSSTVFLPRTDLQVYYTAHANDAWQLIPSQHITPNAASGTVIIDSAFLADKTHGCFKLKQVQMVDNRGFVPASIINKTQAVIDATVWVTSPMHGIDNASWGYAASANKFQDFCADEPSGSFTTGNPNGNYITAVSGGGDFHSVAQASAAMSVESAGISIPAVIKTVPDGTIFHEAYAILSNATLTRTYEWFDVASGVGDSETTIHSIGYALVAVTGPTGGSVIATLPSTNTTNGTTVVDFTDALNAMYDLRNDSSVYGFAIFPVIGGSISGDMEEFVKSLVELPPMGPFDLNDDGYIPEDPGYCEPGGPTMPSDWEGHTTLYYKSLQITWGAVYIQSVVCRVEYPLVDRERDIVQPRFPAFVDLPAA